MTDRGIQFLSVDDALQLHADTISRDGGSPGVRDRGLLESALMMPCQQFGGQWLHPGLAEMAAAYLFHLTSNHAFVDGNKRIGALAALVFLRANGVQNLPEPAPLEAVSLAVASGDMSKDALIAWFREVLGG